jgi:iron complex transport system substrate-binding protein
MRALALIVLLVLTACNPAFVPPEVEPGDYRRIVSLTPSITEMLFAIGAGDRVVGITSWCNYPEETAGLTRVGDFLNPNMEAVLALEPDLIVLAPTGTLLRQSYDNFASLGLTVLVLWNNTLEETFGAMETLGRTLRLDVGSKVKRLRTELAAEQKRWKGAPRVRTLWAVGHRPLIAVGPGTFQDEILSAAGGLNILKGEESWPHLNEEFVIEADPEVIIDSSMGNETVQLAQRVWGRLGSVKAVKEGRVHVIVDDALFRPGPRMVDAVRLLGNALHPASDE